MRSVNCPVIQLQLRYQAFSRRILLLPGLASYLHGATLGQHLPLKKLQSCIATYQSQLHLHKALLTARLLPMQKP